MEEVPKYDNHYELFKSVLANGCSISFESAWGDGPSFSWSGEMPEYMSKILQDYDFASDFLADVAACLDNPSLDDECDSEWGSIYLKNEKVYLSLTREEKEYRYGRYFFKEDDKKQILNNLALAYNSSRDTDEEPLIIANNVEVEFFDDELVVFKANPDGFEAKRDANCTELGFYVGDEEYYLSGNYLLGYFESTLKFMNKLSLYSDVQEIYFYGDGYKVIGTVDADISTTLKSWKYTRPQ